MEQQAGQDQGGAQVPQEQHVQDQQQQEQQNNQDQQNQWFDEDEWDDGEGEEGGDQVQYDEEEEEDAAFNVPTRVLWDLFRQDLTSVKTTLENYQLSVRFSVSLLLALLCFVLSEPVL